MLHLQAAGLRTAGQEPYAYRFDRTHYTTDLQEQYSGLEAGQEEENVAVAVAGRVMARRVMGKLAFLSIRDDKGQVQVRRQLHPVQSGMMRESAWLDICHIWMGLHVTMPCGTRIYHYVGRAMQHTSAVLSPVVCGQGPV